MTPKDYAYYIVAHPELEPPDMAVMLAQAYLDLDAENKMLRKYNAGMMEQMDSFTKTYLALDARATALRDAARDMMDDYLIEYGRGAAETVDIESLGWGSNCAPVRLIRALRAFDAATSGDEKEFLRAVRRESDNPLRKDTSGDGK